MQGRVLHETFESRILVGNPLGDPSERDLYVYLPRVYDGVRRLPVVYLLAAFGGDGRSFLDGSPWKPSVVERFDALVASGASMPAILVMPDASTRWGGSQYLDSSATGRYQSYLVDELVPHVDARWRTIAGPEGRAAAGRSSGGFGALRLALDRPGVVGAIASHAGDAAFELSLRPMLVATAVAMARYGSPEAFVEAMRLGGPRAPGDYDAIFVLAAIAAYDPDADAPFPYVRWPFDPATAAIDEGAFARLAAHDPVTLLGARGDALRSLGFAFIDAGSGDEHGLAFGAKALARGLEQAGVSVFHAIHEGGHRGTAYRFESSLPAVLAALSAGR